MKREGFPMGGVVVATTVLALPWSSVLMVAVFGVGALYLFVGLVREFGAVDTDPSRCPACRRDELVRVETARVGARVPLLHCRGCGEAFRWWGNSLIRDTGGCQLP